jgi:hypothetical protein
MKRSLVNIPTGIRGIILHDVKLKKKDYPQDRVLHIIVTIDDGEGKRGDRIRFFIASGRVNTPRLQAQEQNIFVEQEYTRETFDGCIDIKNFNRRDVLSTSLLAREAIQQIAEPFITKGYAPVYNERYSYRQKDTDTSKTYRSFKFRRELGAIEVYFEGYDEMDELREVSSDLAYWNNDDVPVIPLAPVAPSKGRMSKENWLKKNYPGMTELPKWRFPAVACN